MPYRRPLQAALGVAVLATAAMLGPGVSASAATSSSSVAAQEGDQLMMAYFRTWRDKAADPEHNKAVMSDLPAAVDVAFVFDANMEPDNPFYDVLRDEYVPELHERGTKLVWTYGIQHLLNPDFPNTPAGHQDLASKLIADRVTAYGLDGIDVDVEQALSEPELAKATGVFKALRAKLGPDKLLIYDTNMDGSAPLFRNIASSVDYVLQQSYGRAVDGLQATWDSYRPYISAKQYLIGFSFYEENGARWGDVTEPFESSRAYQYAKWQPPARPRAGSSATPSTGTGWPKVTTRSSRRPTNGPRT